MGNTYRFFYVMLLGALMNSCTLFSEDIPKTDTAKYKTLEGMYVLSDLDTGDVDIRLDLSDEEKGLLESSFIDLYIIYPDKKEIHLTRKASSIEENMLSFKLKVDPVIPWSPPNPDLYLAKAVFKSEKDGDIIAVASRRFGIRKIERRKDTFYFNNHPIFLRMCGHEYESFLSNLDYDGIVKRLKQVKRYGFNSIRHHSHVPGEEYLKAADEIGVLIQMEIHGRIGTDLESEKYKKSRQDWINMIVTGRKHPCSLIYSMGNEIYKNDPGLISCQDALYDIAKQMDPYVLVLNRSGSRPHNDDHGKYDLIERPIGEYEHIAEFAGEAFTAYLRGDRKGRSDEFPIIAHEYPLVSSYPNIELAHKYDEVPSWLELTADNARTHGLEHLLPLFVKNSESIQNLCRKEMLEEARKYPELDGYSMLRFTDRMARVSGVVDDFSDPKNVTAEEFLRTNGETVLLCSWNKRTFEYGEILEATLDISHHGVKPYSAPECVWRLMNGPVTLSKGAFKEISVNPVSLSKIGTVKIEIPKLYKPSKLTLQAYIPGTVPYIRNEWYFWAFPKELKKPGNMERITIWDPLERMQIYTAAYPGIIYNNDENWKVDINIRPYTIVTDSWQNGFYDYLDAGGRIWIISDKSWPWPEKMGIFGLHWTTFDPAKQAPIIFPSVDESCNKWLTICSNSKSRYGNSGTLVAPHPSLGDFPHEGFCDMQFFPMIYRANSLQFAYFPKDVEPVIRTIDSFWRGTSKGYMAELGVGKGRIFISTLNLTQSFERSSSTRYMFNNILNYVSGDDFDPEVKIGKSELHTMLDDFAKVYRERKPLTRDEMSARYKARMKNRAALSEVIVLPIYDAKGVEENKLGVHWEYAQTQWFLNARGGESITWDFENKSAGDFECTLHLASPLDNIEFSLKIDDREERENVFEGSDGWEVFKPLKVTIKNLSPGNHKLKLSVKERPDATDRKIVQIRDMEIVK